MPEVEHVKSDQVLPNEILVIIMKRPGHIQEFEGITMLTKKITQFAPSVEQVKVLDEMLHENAYAYINEENL